MAALRIEGEPIAREIRDLLSRIRPPRPPRVVALHNRDNAACRIYRRMQEKLFAGHGVAYEAREVDAGSSESDALALVESLSRDPGVTGVTVHVPLPAGWDLYRLLGRLDPAKDVEGMHPHNLGMLSYREHLPEPCAAAAAITIARHVRPSLKGLEIVVVGHSAMVGKPITMLLLQSATEAPTPTVCHVATRSTREHTRRADVLFVAAGRPALITGDDLKPGATVIDIGVNRLPDGKIVGDVEAESAARVAAHLTPVPGGVGPVTLAMLLRNVLACAGARV